MTYNEYLGMEIKQIRGRNNLTQEEFGREFGVSKQTVSGWERGKLCPGIDIITRINEKYGVNLIIKRKKEVHEMDVMQLREYDNLEDLKKAVDEIIEAVKLDNTHSNVIKKWLRDTLILVIGYDVYYSARVYGKDFSLDWGSVAYELTQIITRGEDDESRTEIMAFSRLSSEMLQKIYLLHYRIGAELFEDCDEEHGFYDGRYDHELGYLADSCASELLMTLPEEENSICTLYRVAVLELTNLVNSLWDGEEE